MARLGTCIEQDTNFGVKNAAKSAEEPSVRVDLFAVLLLETEHHLDWRESGRAIIKRSDELLIRCDGKLCGVLENVGDRLFSIDIFFHDTILVDTDSCEQIKGTFVAGVDTIKDQTYDNLLPCRSTLVPELGLLQVYNVPDVLHDTVQCSRGKDLVFVVVGNGDEKLSMAVVHGWAKIVSILEGEIRRIAGGSSV